MQIFLLWRRRSGHPQPDTQAVAQRLARRFSPLFEPRPLPRTLETESASLAILELPVRNWRPPFHEDDGDRWAHAVQYPLDAPAHVERATPGGSGVLTRLAAELESDPRPWLDRLAPPFSLVWGSHGADDVLLQNDGLGHAQVFEYEDDGLWAATNKIAALAALGLPLEIEPSDWAARVTLGWFPLDTTGYRHVRFLAPGTQVRLSGAGVTRTRCDVLPGWVRPDPMPPGDCAELARASLIQQVRAASPHWDEPSAGLSGGWDSRAVVASLRAAGVEVSLRVKGLPGREDVAIASELARTAGLGLRIKSEVDLPPDDAEGCRNSIERALLWQAGYMATAQHKTFLANGSLLAGGEVNVMGQHGEIGRSKLARRIKAARHPVSAYEDRLVRQLMKKMPPFLRSELRHGVEELIRNAYRKADAYGIEGPARIDFFHLSERTRRWASGSLNSQTGPVFAPYLNRDYIRAAFAYPGHGKQRDPFQRHIVQADAPEWAAIRTTKKVDREYVPGTSWRQPTTDNENYDSALYWRDVGAPVIGDALERGGAWTAIFDPGAARERWLERPDPLAIVQQLDGAVLG